MNLTRQAPRSPNIEMLGMVSLARTIDKARAFNAGLLGDYEFNCPHDVPLFEFLGTDARTFAHAVDNLGSDNEIARWISSQFLAEKTFAEIAAFNQERRNWAPAKGSASEAYFHELRRKLAPHRDDIRTWFELIDFEECHAMELSPA